MALWTKFAFYHVLLTASLHFVYGISEYECDTGVLLNERLTTVNVKAPEPDGTKPKLCIFCYDGLERTWLKMFVNPRIIITQAKLKMAPDDLIVYYGHNESEVQTQSESITLFSFNTVLLKEEHSFSPFNKSCIGLSSSKAYRVLFKVKNPELWYIAYIAIGTVVFFFAPTWSRNVVFHYTTGMTVGVLASVLVVMFILTRLMPQRMKTVSYVVMAMSSSACLFMFQYVKNYLQDIIQDHWQYAVGYVLVAAILSFALIYRFGPVTDGRSLNLLCWIMQAVGLFCIYQGTQIPEASAAIILLVLTVYFCPRLVSGWGARFRRRLFPTQHRFLTEEEWQKEAEEETRKALEDLKQYCKSPQCDKWSVVRRLKSPTATRTCDKKEN